MAEELERHRDGETRDIGHPAWAELSAIVFALVVVMVAMALLGTFVQV